MIQKAHLRSLEFRLSAVATATSLAETNPSMNIPPDCKWEVKVSLSASADIHCF
jgi:hypothetical protein